MSKIIYVTQFVFFLTIGILVLNKSQDINVNPIQLHSQFHTDFDLNVHRYQSKIKD